MTTTDIDTRKFPVSTVIGVFLDYEGANRAIDELRQANFSYERIRVIKRGSGRFVDTLRGLFTGQASMASSTSDDLIQMGMPEYEAHYYQYELDSDHVLLIMNADDRPEAAFGIMRQNGAFDINSRLKLNQTGATLKAEKNYETEKDREVEEEREDKEVRGDRQVDDSRMPPVAAAPANTPNEPYPDTRSVPRYVDEGRRDGVVQSAPSAPASDTQPTSSDPEVAQSEEADRQAARNA